MNREDIERMAEESGIVFMSDIRYTNEAFERFARLVALFEREECHKLAIKAAEKAGTLGRQMEAFDIAVAISSRSRK